MSADDDAHEARPGVLQPGRNDLEQRAAHLVDRDVRPVHQLVDAVQAVQLFRAFLQRFDTLPQTIVTVIEGAARVQTGAGSLVLGRFETVIVPAEQGAYRVEPAPFARLLKASVDA